MIVVYFKKSGHQYCFIIEIRKVSIYWKRAYDMKKTCFTLVLSILILFGFLNSAQSADSYPNSGVLMFKLGGNDSIRNESLLEAEIKDWLSSKGTQRDIDLEF